MPPRIVGIAGSFNRPSKTRVLVEHVAALAADRYGFSANIHDLQDVGPSLGTALWRNELDEQAKGVIDEIVHADALIIGSPTFKGSYPGLFKHLIENSMRDRMRDFEFVLLENSSDDTFFELFV